MPIKEKKKILMVGAECAPFAKVGGLADVLGTLPRELNKLDMDVRVMMPFHHGIKEKYRDETEHITDFFVHVGWKNLFVGIDRLVYNGVIFYFVDNEDMFGEKIYKGGLEEGEQYAFFARAVCESLDHIDFIPDVVHCNDWHTGMVPMLLKVQYGHRPQGACKTVFTIHNLMYQGQFSFEQIQYWLGVPSWSNSPEYIEHFGCASYLKAALVFSDLVSTVSPTYAQEIRDPLYSCELEGILNARVRDTWGIINGIDMEEFDPEHDKFLDYHYSKDDLSGKLENKKQLIYDLGLTVSADTPVIGVVTRLTEQKGIELLMPVFHELMQEDVAVVILGSGDAKYENFLKNMEYLYKGRVCSYIGYNNEVAHHIYAGSDLFLMPSKFEPCGISQMIALRYGTLPIVRETGGLKDTVTAFNEFTMEGNGFSFHNYNAHDMLYVIRYALWIMKDKNKKEALIRSAMECNYSFAVSASKYRDMFLSLL